MRLRLLLHRIIINHEAMPYELFILKKQLLERLKKINHHAIHKNHVSGTRCLVNSFLF